MTSHNGHKYIREQLDSILCQLGAEDEVVISDDGSEDFTIEIIKSFSDPRIKLHRFRQPLKYEHTHSYVCRNFENALKHAAGDYIFLADQDDWWMPDKIEKCMKALQLHTLVVHQAEMCDGQLSEQGRRMYKDNFVFHNYLALKRGKYYGCTMAFRRELLSHILPFPKYLILHDHWIGCMAELTGDVYYETEPLIKYRQHGLNTSGGASANGILFRLRYRLYMYVKLMVRSATT